MRWTNKDVCEGPRHSRRGRLVVLETRGKPLDRPFVTDEENPARRSSLAALVFRRLVRSPPPSRGIDVSIDIFIGLFHDYVCFLILIFIFAGFGWCYLSIFHLLLVCFGYISVLFLYIICIHACICILYRHIHRYNHNCKKTNTYEWRILYFLPH